MTRVVSLLAILAMFSAGCGNPMAPVPPGGGPAPTAGGLSADPSIEELGKYLVAKGVLENVRVGDIPGRVLYVMPREGKISHSQISVSKHDSHDKALKFVEETDHGFAWRNFAFVTIVPKDDTWIEKLQAGLPPPTK